MPVQAEDDDDSHARAKNTSGDAADEEIDLEDKCIWGDLEGYDTDKGHLPLKNIYLYNEPDSALLHDSDHAKELQLDKISILDIMGLKADLEKCVWKLFAFLMAESNAGSWLMVNVNETRLNCFHLHCVQICHGALIWFNS